MFCVICKIYDAIYNLFRTQLKTEESRKEYQYLSTTLLILLLLTYAICLLTSFLFCHTCFQRFQSGPCLEEFIRTYCTKLYFSKRL